MNACSCRSLIRYLQTDFSHHHGLTSFKSTTTMDHHPTKKHQFSKPVWRPMSSQQDQGSSKLQVVQCGSKASEIQDYSEKREAISETGKHSVSIEVAASLIRFIKGKWGSTQKQIEDETGTKLIFPLSRQENSIVIEGSSSDSITKASEKIQVILEEAIKSPNLDYSHFISLPLAINPGLVNKLMNFQNSILGSIDEKSDGDLGIDQSIFIKPKTFHLTILMLKLWNTERITAAANVLQKVSSKVVDALEGKPISVRLKGLDCMKGPLSKARVLYTPVEVIGGESRLLRACQVITDALVEAGLVLERDAHQKLKLHGTVMNVRHRKSKQWTNKRFDSFDARTIVEKYGSEDWGEYVIPEVHLSQRFVFDEEGYYHCCAKVSFPENKEVE